MTCACCSPEIGRRVSHSLSFDTVAVSLDTEEEAGELGGLMEAGVVVLVDRWIDNISTAYMSIISISPA